MAGCAACGLHLQVFSRFAVCSYPSNSLMHAAWSQGFGLLGFRGYFLGVGALGWESIQASLGADTAFPWAGPSSRGLHGA
jgi:hypothetical protein